MPVVIKSVEKSTKPTGCYICASLHMARECPKWEKLAVLVTKEDNDAEHPDHVNPLQLLEALQAMKSSAPILLLYVHAIVNDRNIDTMVDTAAKDNFVSNGAAVRLALSISEHTSHIKVINSKVQLVARLVKGMTISLGKVELWSMPLNDFELIIGTNLLTISKAVVIPHLGGMLSIE